MKSKKHKICGIITKAFGVKAFMLDNLRYVAENGPFDSYFICERTDEFTESDTRTLNYIPIDIKGGNVSPWEVAKCVFRLYRIFRKQKFDIIQYASSNAALYSSIAGWLARVPVRIYCQWGISYTDYSGIRRWFYKTMVKVTCLFSTNIQPDSFANLRFAHSERLYDEKKGSVIGKGSATGVDTKKYDISQKKKWRSDIRKKYGIPADAMVLGFVGRLVPEKGVNELLASFLSRPEANLRLMIVGPNYEIDRLDKRLWNDAHNDSRIIFCGLQADTAPFYAAMDFLILPSYREGFGSVILESAAMGVPSICSNIKGPTDFVKDNINGIICEPMSCVSLKSAFEKAISMNHSKYEELSETAYKMVKSDFDADVFRKLFLKDRLNLLEGKR